ncbi:hypothetical protein [Treponema sp. J25]|uniref:hypothetical protein n=1 Tax=Treponema sp. J25 TaxID=2094121 RepID=UPI001FB72822|nr:hypothetical protein [Treponema sp. J25]
MKFTWGPSFKGMGLTLHMAEVAGVVFLTAFKLNGYDIKGPVVVYTTGLAVYYRPINWNLRFFHSFWL